MGGADSQGGNIVGAANHPTDTFIEQLPKLVKTYADGEPYNPDEADAQCPRLCSVRP
jgi:hypothetical protein